MEIKFEKRDSNSGENLMARGRPDKRDGRIYRGKSRFKGKLKCILCHKEGQFKRDCSEKKKHKEKEQNICEVSIVADGYDSAEVLSISITNSGDDWVLDFGCSFTCVLQNSGMKHTMKLMVEKCCWEITKLAM